MAGDRIAPPALCLPRQPEHARPRTRQAGTTRQPPEDLTRQVPASTSSQQSGALYGCDKPEGGWRRCSNCHWSAWTGRLFTSGVKSMGPSWRSKPKQREADANIPVVQPAANLLSALVTTQVRKECQSSADTSRLRTDTLAAGHWQTSFTSDHFADSSLSTPQRHTVRIPSTFRDQQHTLSCQVSA